MADEVSESKYSSWRNIEMALSIDNENGGVAVAYEETEA